MNMNWVVGCSFAVLACSGVSQARTVVFQSVNDNGFFTPFNSGNAATVRYGDSGWLGGPGAPPVGLEAITLGLAVFGSSGSGTTDLHFSFHDGDPSGLVFGSGQQLFSTTVTNLALPDSSEGPAFFSLTIPLAGVVTLGGFNNIGWSVGLSNFNYSGGFGFQASSANGQVAGFFTNNASFFNGSNWSLFAFGSDPTFGIAQFVATVTVPSPGVAMLLGGSFAAFARRRR